MTNNKVKILLVISILTISSLSCSLWEYVFPLFDIPKIRNFVISLGAGEEENSGISQNIGNDQPYSLENCACPGIGLPLNNERSNASNNSYPSSVYVKNTPVPVQVLGTQTCVWEQSYKSAEKVGTISVRLDLTHFQNADQARVFQSPLQTRLEEKPSYCEQDHDCTITAQEFSPGRSYYAEETIYRPSPDAGALPSSHFAYLVKYLPKENGFHVIDLLVSHPELSPGDPWARNIASSVETCLDEISQDW